MRKAICGIVLVPLLLAGCSPDRLKQATRALLIVDTVVYECQAVVVEGNYQGLITDQDMRAVLAVCDRVKIASEKSKAILKSLNKLEPTSAQTIVTVIEPVVQAVQEAMETGLLGIKNQEARKKVMLALFITRSSLDIVRIILVSNEPAEQRQAQEWLAVHGKP